ncbi:hypothetical protein M9H77_02780 [Catharanthus roseus]|uniref:Uncharacterized protein n=1 Tax=Catharanthus roseus TaxID=4058 RepID=A0ACC0C9N1_CATRO|nr:hypothetical protein M9H77_02780 [Catharanthus roseus]
MPVLQPQLLQHVQTDLLAPLSAIWCTSFDYSQLPTHVLLTYKGREEVDDMATRVIQGPPSSPTQITSFVKKVQTIICRCMPSRFCPRSPYRTVVLVELRGALIDCLVAGHVEAALLSLLIRVDKDMQAPDVEERESHPNGLGTSYAPPSPGTVSSSILEPSPLGLGFSSFQAPPPPGIVGSSFQAPPPPSTVGSSTLHMSISYASSSDSDERTNDVTPAQQLGFSYRVAKKTTRFTPSD